MAAFEDFEFFRTATAPARRTGSRSATPARPERDALRAELERLHLEVERLRARVRRRSWAARLRRLVSQIERLAVRRLAQ